MQPRIEKFKSKEEETQQNRLDGDGERNETSEEPRRQQLKHRSTMMPGFLQV